MWEGPVEDLFFPVYEIMFKYWLIISRRFAYLMFIVGEVTVGEMSL
jgi:hypothetical protein